MDDEFSLVDSETVGTGYVLNPNQDGSISHITDELGEDHESKMTISDNNSKQNSEENEGKWNDGFEDHAPDNNDDVRSSSNPSSSRRLKNRSIPLNLLVPTNPKEAIDFVKDDKPSEMTLSRRIALRLMKYKWYYPNRDGKKSSCFGSSKAENIDGSLQPSLEKAWAYFEHVTLPRFVYDGKNSIWISDTSSPRIWEFSLDTEEFSSYSFDGVGTFMLTQDNKGRIWFTDTPRHQIGFIDPESKQIITKTTPMIFYL